MFFLFTIVGMSTDIKNHWGINFGPTVSVMNNVGRAAINRPFITSKDQEHSHPEQTRVSARQV